MTKYPTWTWLVDYMGQIILPMVGVVIIAIKIVLSTGKDIAKQLFGVQFQPTQGLVISTNMVDPMTINTTNTAVATVASTIPVVIITPAAPAAPTAPAVPTVSTAPTVPTVSTVTFLTKPDVHSNQKTVQFLVPSFELSEISI